MAVLDVKGGRLGGGRGKWNVEGSWSIYIDYKVNMATRVGRRLSNGIRRQLRSANIGSRMELQSGPIMSFLQRAGCKAAAAGLAVAVCLSPAWGQQLPNAASTEPGPSISAPANPATSPVATTPSPNLSHVPLKYDVSKIGSRNVGSGVNFYSIEKEIALGKQLSAQVEQTSKLVSDPVVNEYINRIGQNLVRNSDAKVPFTIKVIDDDTVNAFALPGGFFYVDSGLILAADNEAELAGVMAHEIAHVAARHATKQATKGQLFNLASIPLIFIGGPAGYAVQEAMALAVPLGFLKFSRNAEREADLLGLEYSYASGYDPQAFVEFFEKLEAREKKKPGFLAKTFATHPMTADRVKSAQQEIAKYLPDRPQYVLDTSEFDQVKARLAQLTNASRITNKSGEARPTLRRREGSDKVDTGGSSGNDEGRPTLKRRSESGDTTTNSSDTTSTDEQRPTLKRAPSPQPQ